MTCSDVTEITKFNANKFTCRTGKKRIEFAKFICCRLECKGNVDSQLNSRLEKIINF